MYIVSVLVEHPVHSLDTTFSYLSKVEVKTGVRVSITFNRRKIVGYVTGCEYTLLSKEELEERDGFKYQFISKVIDDEPLLNDELIQLAERMAEMTLSPRISCLQTMLPQTLKPSTHKDVGIKHKKAIRILKQGTPKTKKQAECLEFLNKEDVHFLGDLPYSRVLLNGLIDQGFVEIYDQEIRRDPYIGENYLKVKTNIALTPSQQAVVDGITSKEERISLIHGVTGSGKTEVYLALTREILKKHLNVIMLVPEISLTPVMVKHFKSRFHADVAILHSRLSQGEKYDEYRRIRSGEVRIVVGARSAIFAPLDHIGMIIMDEEHDTSYKQENTPRYHTLQIAKMRASYHHARIVLGSATPLLESYARAKRGIYDLYEMPERINKHPLPKVEIVDMSDESRQGRYSLMSAKMVDRLQKTIDKGEQAIVLLNKRGYASFVKCGDCQEVIRCPHCDVTLTYHKKDDRLKCHYCDFTMKMPHKCPHCDSTNLKKIGYGTQRIEEEIENKIENSKVMRFDYDTTRRKNEHLRMLEAFQNKEANVLLGTQMIAKGLDFENVTFVGVLMADLTLTLPDYRSGERTYELLCQVAGRSGRGAKQGTVLIQTYNPDHYAITSAAKQDYELFYKQEMAYRKIANYPPFIHIVAINIRSPKEDQCEQAAMHIKKYLEEHLKDVRIIGPSPSTIFKMQDHYREHILIKYKDAVPVYRALKAVIDYYSRSTRGKVSVSCDFNPYSLY